MDSAKNSSSGGLASVISVVVLLLSASGVFGELRSALDRIWDVKPADGTGIRNMLRERIFSFGMVLAVGFLLLASLILSAFLAWASSFLSGAFPLPKAVATGIDLLVTIVGVSAVFALIFKYVPQARVGWTEALKGGMFTGILFTVGKYVLGVYLAKAAVGSAYGAAGSVVVIIVWVYYTAQIVFFGAEFAHAIGKDSNEPHRTPAVPGVA